MYERFYAKLSNAVIIVNSSGSGASSAVRSSEKPTLNRSL
jgi:hypothetical protein